MEQASSRGGDYLQSAVKRADCITQHLSEHINTTLHVDFVCAAHVYSDLHEYKIRSDHIQYQIGFLTENRLPI